MNTGLPEKLHFVGVGGIGMSGLAAMCRRRGCLVTGSDRGADRPENAALIGALKAGGVTVFPQDGSFAAAGLPDALVYSTAIENDNPDFTAAADVRRIHRSGLLGILIDGFPGCSVAVTGSCGKSSVSAYLAEAMLNAGKNPDALVGGLVKNFIRPGQAGNYRPGDGSVLVFEADESDKSLLNYSADYALILNIGTDHYSKSELAGVFAEFLRKVRRGAVVSREVYDAVSGLLPAGFSLPLADFDLSPHSGSQYWISGYRPGVPGGTAEVNGEWALRLPQIGFHTAANALAVFAMLEMTGIASGAAAIAALERFGGVWRRCDYAGRPASGAAVYDDYAHNPEKIISCLGGIRESTSGRLIAVFQPHGYGPFGFMRRALFEALEIFLRPDDRFVIMEPYYAGGTSCFKPSAAEVCAEWQAESAHSETYLTMPDRAELRRWIDGLAAGGDAVVIMGARDNSLSGYAASLTAESVPTR